MGTTSTPTTTKAPKGAFRGGPLRVAIYARVSTDDQTTDNQLLELRAWAEHAGHSVVAEYVDNGISGAKGREGRPQFDKLLKDAVRRKFDLVAAWSVDRLGRSLVGLIECLQELHGAGVDLFLHQQAVDTTTPAGRALFQMLGVFAEFERAMVQERVKAGMARARAGGVTFGRPKIDVGTEERIRVLLAKGTGIQSVAKLVGCGVSAVQRVKREAAAAQLAHTTGERRTSS